ncbi:lipocalin family protein [Adhaeribacter swui]|uniref:Lipocalin family protein n=1 Tax=Adhaeribacter swui TaxID=2086471 RepID=A0A7G7G440_9BACT|nr:lipocalin family protein [Adhaeribacter swui]QNF31924.1 lipocalin family protein [Adhaeribacter swui]
MMILEKLLLFLFFVPIAFAGCDKEEHHAVAQTSDELLVDKNWVLTAYTSQVNNQPVKDEFAFYDDCNADDIYRFFKNNTFEVSEGATKCDSADPQVYSQGTWSINPDNFLTMQSGNTPESAKIVEITKSKLVLSATESLENQVNVQVLTFTAM